MNIRRQNNNYCKCIVNKNNKMDLTKGVEKYENITMLVCFALKEKHHESYAGVAISLGNITYCLDLC